MAHHGRKIKYERLLKGYTLKRLAELVGCSESMVSKVENSRLSPSLAMLHRIAAALEVSVSDLILQENDDLSAGKVVVFPANRFEITGKDRDEARAGVWFDRILPFGHDGLLQVQMLERATAAASNTPLYKRLVKSLDAIRRQGARLSMLVDQLLDVTRISSGGLQIEPEEFNLVEMLEDIATRFRSSQDIRLQVELPDKPVNVRWDRLRIDQVVTNLLMNAFKYGGDKPVDLKLARNGKDALSVSITDRGIGIAPDALERIFGRFERAVSQREYGGLGLGLFIVKQIVDAHGGTVRAESALGSGSTFHVDLPTTPPSARVAASQLALTAE